jgi:hypothetical protein
MNLRYDNEIEKPPGLHIAIAVFSTLIMLYLAVTNKVNESWSMFAVFITCLTVNFALIFIAISKKRIGSSVDDNK